MFQSVRSLLRAMVRIVCTTVVVVEWGLTPGRAPTHHPSLRTAAAADVRDGPADRVWRAGGNLCAVGPGHGLGVDQGHHRAQVNYRRRCRQEDNGNGWLDFRLCLFSPHPFRQSFKGGGGKKKPKSALFTFHQLVGVCPCQQRSHYEGPIHIWPAAIISLVFATVSLYWRSFTWSTSSPSSAPQWDKEIGVGGKRKGRGLTCLLHQPSSVWGSAHNRAMRSQGRVRTVHDRNRVLEEGQALPHVPNDVKRGRHVGVSATASENGQEKVFVEKIGERDGEGGGRGRDSFQSDDRRGGGERKATASDVPFRGLL